LQFIIHFPQLLGPLLNAFLHVIMQHLFIMQFRTRADKSHESAFRIETWFSDVEDPAVFAVGSP
jgi:DNA-directed RNA polymerase specialized sigma24 family protein